MGSRDVDHYDVFLINAFHRDVTARENVHAHLVDVIDNVPKLVDKLIWVRYAHCL